MESIQLEFSIEHQSGSRLCWAAVSVSVARFYLQKNVVSQIELAKKIFGDNYNQFCQPEKALSVFGNFSETINRPLKEYEIIRELRNNKPIAACLKHFVGWHLAVIYGIDEKKNLFIADPLYGKSQWLIGKFNKEYRQTYQWTHTYTTIPN